MHEKQWREAHDRYLDRALEVFGESGYHAATVQDIVRRANGSRATFYAHFRDKADIAGCLFERCLPEGREIYARTNEFPDLSPGWVRSWLDNEVLEFWSRHRVEVEIINHAIADDAGVAARHYEWGVRAVSALRVYLRKWTGPCEAVGKLRALLLVLQLERLCYHWFIRDVQHDRSTVLDVLTDLWCRELTVLKRGTHAVT